MKKTGIRIIFIFSMILLSAFAVKADSLAAADSAYMNNNFADASALYEETIMREGVSAGLLYNLGNCYYRQGKEGEAMVCYERAKKLSPDNKEINQNLEFLRSKVLETNKGALQGKAGNVEPDHETFMEGLYRIIAIDTQSNIWAVFAVMAFILFLGAVAMYVFTPNVLARKTGFFSGITFLVFTVIFLIFAFLGAGHFKSQDEVVLTAYSTRLLQQPQETASPTSSPLHKGTKFKIVEEETGADGTEWLKVRLNSDNIGWVKKKQVETI